ncbi:ATP-binding cassette domain-containing protein, partial [Listeria monocytogenes]|nr:ATP-binding cassette domain-containing protein [Listeria monocytogenes]
NNIELGKKEDFPQNIGILINEPTFIPIYSGLKNLLLLAEINHNIDENQVREFMLKVGLEPDNKTIVKNYSLGMKKKLAICQAIMENQSILLLDEPFNGLDFSAMSEIRSILETLKEEGKTILLTSHHQTDLDNFCDKLYFIDNQKLIVFTDEMRKKYFS